MKVLITDYRNKEIFKFQTADYGAFKSMLPSLLAFYMFLYEPESILFERLQKLACSSSSKECQLKSSVLYIATITM